MMPTWSGWSTARNPSFPLENPKESVNEPDHYSGRRKLGHRAGGGAGKQPAQTSDPLVGARSGISANHRNATGKREVSAGSSDSAVRAGDGEAGRRVAGCADGGLRAAFGAYARGAGGGTAGGSAGGFAGECDEGSGASHALPDEPGDFASDQCPLCAAGGGAFRAVVCSGGGDRTANGGGRRVGRHRVGSLCTGRIFRPGVPSLHQ